MIIWIIVQQMFVPLANPLWAECTLHPIYFRVGHVTQLGQQDMSGYDMSKGLKYACGGICCLVSLPLPSEEHVLGHLLVPEE